MSRLWRNGGIKLERSDTSSQWKERVQLLRKPACKGFRFQQCRGGMWPMTPTRQPSLTDAASDRPETGIALDERTHYGHVRYAAIETPGVIWYDPRDGEERLSLGVDTSLDTLDVDERVLSSVRLHGHRNVCGVVDPGERWVLKRNYAEKTEYSVVGDTDETAYHVETYRSSELFEDQAAARDAAAEHVPAYADAEYRNAVAHRTEGGDRDE